MGSNSLPSVLFIWVIYLLATVDSLRCYNCVHLDTELPNGYFLKIPSDESCKPGKIPKNGFLVDCEDIDYHEGQTRSSSALGGLIHGQTPFFVDIAQVNQSPQMGFTYTCANITFDGKFDRRGFYKEFRATFRTFIRNSIGIPFVPECVRDKLGHVIGKVNSTDVRQVLSSYALFLNATATDTNICTCNDPDACNVGPFVEDGGNGNNSGFPSRRAVPSLLAVFLSISLCF